MNGGRDAAGTLKKVGECSRGRRDVHVHAGGRRLCAGRRSREAWAQRKYYNAKSGDFAEWGGTSQETHTSEGRL